MKNTFGVSVSVTLFGESHGAEIGAVIDGLAPGIEIDEAYIASQLSLRRPSGRISTQRKESDPFIIVSGVFEGKTTGTPIAIIISNADQKSKDYVKTRFLARPGHADYTAYCKYHGFEDYRGGGHFSGRITAALVAAGAVCISALKQKGIFIGTHIARLASISDSPFSADIKSDIAALCEKEFALINSSLEEPMKAAVTAAANEGDSVGGILETAVYGMPAGVGEPWFDSVESLLSHALFSIPAVKGIDFSSAFDKIDLKGSEYNDPFCIENGMVITKTNNNGGINGGITNGMPIIFRLAIKPTPSIYKKQDTVDISSNENATLQIEGRHDPAIIHRARVVVDSVTALTLCDILAQRYGTDWLGGK